MPVPGTGDIFPSSQRVSIMHGHGTGCIICGAPLRYHGSQEPMECAICHRTFPSNADCENGHFVCDGCHSSGADSVTEVCLGSSSKDPLEILTTLMRSPGVHMHGPEHHVLVGSALLAAYRNAGGDVDLPSALRELKARGSQVPGGICGLWGCCGAAVSCGAAYSVLTGSTPMSGDSWGRCNTMTSRCLAAIGAIGGPRCCKRDGYTALIAASGYISETLGVRLEPDAGVQCGFFRDNIQCIGARCPYHPRA